MNNPNFNILIYSTRCPTSHQLVMLLKKYNLIKNFELRCIDNMKGEEVNNLQHQGISIVPTMIIPSQNRIFSGKDTFEWIKSIRFFNQKKEDEIRKMQGNQSNIVKNNVFQNKKKQDSRFEYVKEEMSGVSDDYAYLNYDNPQPKSFQYNGQDNKNAIFTAPEIKNKLSESVQNKLIKEQEKIREVQNKEAQEIATEGQIASMMQDEQRQLMQKLQEVQNNPNLKYNKNYMNKF
tara:strand:- start:8940 stop:9641 length:702 start_codon:yes stop_codon:yes gene_type:complete